MGVNGLWQVVQPCARPTNLATLNRKRLAVDASIWIYQFLKAVRDKEGNALRNSHVVGFFRRICKLLWFGILPVFVFDGGAPALKRQTINNRNKRREGRREDAVRTAGKLLAVQMHRRAEEEADRRRREAGKGREEEREKEHEEPLPDMNDVVYVDELGMSKQERMRKRNFRKQDPYHLPDIDRSIAAMAKPEDPRIMSVEELEEYARQFNNGEDINLYDFSKIDFEGDFFKSLPSADRYNILNAARLRSRLRMGLSKEQLEVMFPDRMAFSKFQIERVQERNKLTQQLMKEIGMTGTDLTVNVNARIAGDKDREYVLVKNEGAEGGWALGVVSKEKDLGQSHKPIDVDELQFQYQTKSDPEEEDEDDDFEDVPIAGINRLPPLPSSLEAAGAEHKFHDPVVEDDEDALFVGQTEPEPLVDDTEPYPYTEEEADINRAVALSLRNQYGVELEPSPEAEDDLFQDVDMQRPVWKQKAADTTAKPITTNSGKVVAHIVNNRANATVNRQRVIDTRANDDDSDSDSSIDLQRTLAKANKSKKAQPGPTQPSMNNPFGGPLPFPKLDWTPGIFTKKVTEKPADNATKPVQKTALAVTDETPKPQDETPEDGLAGGFVKDTNDQDAQRPLPPWLADDSDIRDSVKRQRALEEEINAEDRERALEEEREMERARQRNIIEIESSDEGSDVEVIDWSPSPERPAPSGQGEGLTLNLTSVAKETSQASERKPSASLEPTFEDVSLPQDTAAAIGGEQPPVDAAATTASRGPTFEDVAPTSLRSDAELHAEQENAAAERQANTDAFLFGNDTDEEGDGEGDFSDQEEAELLAQLDEEAAEHARFASELNQKTTEENLADYEQELRQLRSQQKKDRRDADEVNHVMVQECQALLRLFGIPYVTAPMEAEAQCAELVHLGLVDGIVTDDSDTFLFGGTRVYKNMFSSSKLVECYLAPDLEREMSLSREQLVALAQLLGSDYTEGIPGVGPVTAVEIISEFEGPDGLERFREWWDDVQMHNRPKEADASFPFRRKFRKSQATKLFLPTGFPSAAVRDAYLNPEVDNSSEAFQWGVPDVEGLRQFLMATIGWTKERTDEVLLPVVKDMNRREAEGTQANITRFFQGGLGAGPMEAFAPRQRNGTSKRMTEAVSKLKQKTLTGVEVGRSSGSERGRGESGAGRRTKRGRQTEADPDGDFENDEASDEVVTSRGKRSGRGRGKRAKA